MKYEHDEGSLRRKTSSLERRGFKASLTITVESSLEDAPKLISTGTAAFKAYSPSSTLTEETEYWVVRELDAEAVRDARCRAEAIAAAEGLKVGPLVGVGDIDPDHDLRENEGVAHYSRAFGAIADELNEVRPTLFPSPPRCPSDLPLSARNPNRPDQPVAFVAEY